jgi:hypothetical protein
LRISAKNSTICNLHKRVASMTISMSAMSPATIAEAIRLELEARRERINRELCTFPTPIPGCDVSFNRLLEDRARVVDELLELSRMGSGKEDAGRLLRYVRGNGTLDDQTKADLEAALTAVAGQRPLPLSSTS